MRACNNRSDQVGRVGWPNCPLILVDWVCRAVEPFTCGGYRLLQVKMVHLFKFSVTKWLANHFRYACQVER